MEKWFFYVVGTVNLADCNEFADPACLSFNHLVVWAEDEDAAYREGQRIVGFHQSPGFIRNDYVIAAKV